MPSPETSAEKPTASIADVIQQQDKQLIRKVDPFLSVLVDTLDREDISPEQTAVVRNLLEESIFVPPEIGYLKANEIKHLITLGVFGKVVAHKLGRYISGLETTQQVALNYKILKENEDFAFVQDRLKSGEEVDEDGYYERKHQHRLASYAEQHDPNGEGLIYQLMSLDDMIMFSQREDDIEKNILDQRKETLSHISEYLLDIAGDGTQEKYSSQTHRVKLETNLKAMVETVSFVQLLSREYRDLLSHPLRNRLIADFDDRFRDKFFDEKGGLEKDYHADMEYLEKHGLSESDYQQLIRNLVDEAGLEIDLPADSKHEVNFKRGIGVRPGSLDNPFTGRLVEHIAINGHTVSEIGVYLNPNLRNDRSKLAFVISGAYEFMFEQGLYQSPDMMYSLSPRKILPILKQNLEIFNNFLTRENTELLDRLEL